MESVRRPAEALSRVMRLAVGFACQTLLIYLAAKEPLNESIQENIRGDPGDGAVLFGIHGRIRTESDGTTLWNCHRPVRSGYPERQYHAEEPAFRRHPPDREQL